MSRKQPDLLLEPIVFDAAGNGSKYKEPHMPAKGIALEDAVHYYFNLTYRFNYLDCSSFYWNIETLPDVKEMHPSPCLSSFLDDYTINYDRSTEAACRGAVDLIISYCLAELKGRDHQLIGDEVPPIWPTTPKLWTNVKAFRDISFAHSINDTPNSEGVVIGGRVDHGVGIVIRPIKKPYRRIHSLLLCIDAKLKGNLESAYGELVVYLASLRESRVNRGKDDSSVYGIASDGLKYVFVTITDEGVLLFSKQFDIMKHDLPVVLGCLRYILEKANSMSQSEAMGVDDDADEVLDPDDSPYLSGAGRASPSANSAPGSASTMALPPTWFTNPPVDYGKNDGDINSGGTLNGSYPHHQNQPDLLTPPNNNDRSLPVSTIIVPPSRSESIVDPESPNTEDHPQILSSNHRPIQLPQTPTQNGAESPPRRLRSPGDWSPPSVELDLPIIPTTGQQPFQHSPQGAGGTWGGGSSNELIYFTPPDDNAQSLPRSEIFVVLPSRPPSVVDPESENTHSAHNLLQSRSPSVVDPESDNTHSAHDPHHPNIEDSQFISLNHRPIQLPQTQTRALEFERDDSDRALVLRILGREIKEKAILIQAREQGRQEGFEEGLKQGRLLGEGSIGETSGSGRTKSTRRSLERSTNRSSRRRITNPLNTDVGRSQASLEAEAIIRSIADRENERIRLQLKAVERELDLEREKMKDVEREKGRIEKTAREERERRDESERERVKEREASQAKEREKEREIRDALKKQAEEGGRLRRAKERLELEREKIKEQMEREKQDVEKKLAEAYKDKEKFEKLLKEEKEKAVPLPYFPMPPTPRPSSSASRVRQVPRTSYTEESPRHNSSSTDSEASSLPLDILQLPKEPRSILSVIPEDTSAGRASPSVNSASSSTGPPPSWFTNQPIYYGENDGDIDRGGTPNGSYAHHQNQPGLLTPPSLHRSTGSYEFVIVPPSRSASLLDPESPNTEDQPQILSPNHRPIQLPQTQIGAESPPPRFRSPGDWSPPLTALHPPIFPTTGHQQAFQHSPPGAGGTWGGGSSNQPDNFIPLDNNAQSLPRSRSYDEFVITPPSRPSSVIDPKSNNTHNAHNFHHPNTEDSQFLSPDHRPIQLPQTRAESPDPIPTPPRYTTPDGIPTRLVSPGGFMGTTDMNGGGFPPGFVAQSITDARGRSTPINGGGGFGGDGSTREPRNQDLPPIIPNPTVGGGSAWGALNSPPRVVSPPSGFGGSGMTRSRKPRNQGLPPVIPNPTVGGGGGWGAPNGPPSGFGGGNTTPGPRDQDLPPIIPNSTMGGGWSRPSRPPSGFGSGNTAPGPRDQDSPPIVPNSTMGGGWSRPSRPPSGFGGGNATPGPRNHDLPPIIPNPIVGGGGWGGPPSHPPSSFGGDLARRPRDQNLPPVVPNPTVGGGWGTPGHAAGGFGSNAGSTPGPRRSHDISSVGGGSGPFYEVNYSAYGYSSTNGAYSSSSYANGDDGDEDSITVINTKINAGMYAGSNTGAGGGRRMKKKRR